MSLRRVMLWISIGGLPVLLLVSMLVEDPSLRAILAVVSVTPLLYTTIQLAAASRRGLAPERRKYLLYRTITDEFLTHVRYLNQLAVAAQRADAPPDIDAEIGRVLQRMHDLVDGLGQAAGGGTAPERVTAEARSSSQ